MPWEMRDCPWQAASWRRNCTGTGYSSTALYYSGFFVKYLNGDKVATILVFKSVDNYHGNIVGRDSGILPTIALIMSADF
jgi:hypothetical protein